LKKEEVRGKGEEVRMHPLALPRNGEVRGKREDRKLTFSN